MRDSHAIQGLTAIRNDLTAERRVLAIDYKESTNIVETIEKVVRLQTQIEAVDRAISDEKMLSTEDPKYQMMVF